MEVTRHQYGISALVSQMSFRGETGGGAPNRPFPGSKKFHFQNEAKYETFVVEMSFNYDANKTHFQNKGFALSLVLKVKLFGTRKWPIGYLR